MKKIKKKIKDEVIGNFEKKNRVPFFDKIFISKLYFYFYFHFYFYFIL